MSYKNTRYQLSNLLLTVRRDFFCVFQSLKDAVSPSGEFLESNDAWETPINTKRFPVKSAECLK